MRNFRVTNGSFVHSYLFEFERHSPVPKSSWMIDNWHLSLYINGVYLCIIFLLHRYMKNKAPLQLKVPFILWNGVLASYCVFGTWRSLPDILYILSTFGLQVTACDINSEEDVLTLELWTRIFALGKVVELFDTVFIALRKKPVTFAHVAHHVMALTVSWFYYGYNIGCSACLASINYFVHSIMYSYFVMKSMNIKVPSTFPMLITMLHLLEMLFGFLMSLFALKALLTERLCTSTYTACLVGCVMYGFNFIMFLNFFLNSYVFRGNMQQQTKKKKTM